MTTSSNSSHTDNTYVIDAEDALEMARLVYQDRLITQNTGGLFPELSEHSSIKHVLDIACGPGGWVLQVAHAYPEAQVVGIDISQKVIEYARAQAFVQRLDNAQFLLMNALEPLKFPDATFDLVNARLILGFMPPAAWSELLQECFRILQPDGRIRLTEAEYGLSNKPAFEQLSSFFTQALKLSGQSFSPDGRHIGITTMLGRLLRLTGYHNVEHIASAIEFSTGTEAHDIVYQDMMLALQLIQPFLLKWGVTTQAELERLYQQVLVEMLAEDFCGISYYLTVWGEKPIG